MTSSTIEISPSRPAKRPVHWPTVAQLALSLGGLLYLWGQGTGMLTTAFLPRLQQLLPGMERATLLRLAFASFLVGTLFLPSALYAFRRLTGKRGPLPWHAAFVRIHRAALWAAPPLYAAAILAGATLRSNTPAGMLLLPAAHIVAAGAPVWWWLALGSRTLEVRQSPQRRWGVVAAGLGLGPLLSIITEILLVVLLLGAVSLWAIQNPTVGQALAITERRLMFATSNPAAMRRMLRSLLETYPIVRLAFLSAFGVVVPLVEEFFKTLGLWALSGTRLPPREGLLAGMISGGMFALLESAFSMSGGVDTLLGRAGTSLMHIAASGLMGYALASAWQKRRYLRLGGAYLLAVLLHGTWNISVLTIAGSLMLSNGFHWTTATALSLSALGFVVLACLGILLLLGRGRASILPIRREERDGLVENPD